MCLDRAATKTEIKNEFKAQTDLKGHHVGFKIMTAIGELPFQGTGGKLPQSRWINERKYRLSSAFSKEDLSFNETVGRYPTGFHIFVNKSEAIHFWESVSNRHNEVREVYFRKVVARGYQNKRRVIVCKEICFIT